MWIIDSDQAKGNGFVGARPVTFTPVPPSATLAQIRLECRPGPAACLEELLYEPVAASVREASAGDEDVQRAGRLHQEHQEHARAAAIAQADLAAVRAQREREALAARPGCASRLVALQGEADAAQRELDQAQKLAAAVAPDLAKARGEAAELRKRALAAACRERAVELETERRAVLRQLAEVCGPLLDRLYALEQAQEVARQPELVANALGPILREREPAAVA